MPRWKPTETWKGQDVFVIGGGPSLRSFDWSLLSNELTVGCNTAFTLGPEICKLCVFGDPIWFNSFRSELKSYCDSGGIVFTNANTNKFHNRDCSWIWPAVF